MASDLPQQVATISSANNGLLAQPEDPDSFVDAICELAGDRNRARRLGLNGQRCFVDHYSWESQTEKIQQLRGVTWEWREEAPPDAKEQPGMGVIAQEVEKVFPQLVETTPEGLKKVDYAGLIAPLIEAVKELDDRVRSLEARLEEWTRA